MGGSRFALHVASPDSRVRRQHHARALRLRARMANGIFNILNVADLERSHAFYKGLGFKTKAQSMSMGGDGGEMRWVDVKSGDAHSMTLMPREFEGADPEDVAWASGEVGKGVLLNVGVANAARVHEKAIAMGAKPEALEENPWGGRAFMVADPDGYYLMVTDRFWQALSPKAADRAAKGGRAKKAAGRKGAKKSVKKAAKKAARNTGRKGRKVRR